eukprot:scaffold221676_cov31-Tisochrysis_lutea.AAC.7
MSSSMNVAAPRAPIHCSRGHSGKCLAAFLRSQAPTPTRAGHVSRPQACVLWHVLSAQLNHPDPSPFWTAQRWEVALDGKYEAEACKYGAKYKYVRPTTANTLEAYNP